MAKIMFPETEQSLTAGEVRVSVEKPWVNVIDAAAEGASAGMKLVLNVAAMLIAFLALIALLNALLIQLGQGINWALHGFGYRLTPDQLTLEWLFGWALRPLAWLMGVPWQEADEVGTLLGIKTVLNEFVGYVKMSEMASAGQLSERSVAIATYALCGFSNFSSIAIQIGGIGGIAPERKGDLARLGLRAMIAGSLACFQTATIAGMLL
jgi:CNT family concentrative nucleoside transporter